MTEGLLTVNETLNYLKIGRTTLYALVKEGRLKTVKIGKRTLFDKRDIDKFIEENKSR